MIKKKKGKRCRSRIIKGRAKKITLHVRKYWTRKLEAEREEKKEHGAIMWEENLYDQIFRILLFYAKIFPANCFATLLMISVLKRQCFSRFSY